MNFSIVVFGKNEENALPNLLKTLVEFRDRGGEIVFIDTGSTDRTVEIAKEFGCAVHEVGSRFMYTVDLRTAYGINRKFVAEGDKEIIKEGQSFFNYGEARNYAAAMAKNDFVINPDCDETFTTLNIDKIDALIAEGKVRFNFDYIYSHYADGKPFIHFICDRGAFDRTKYQWVGRVHENLPNENATYVGRDVLFVEHWPVDAAKRTGSHSDLPALALSCYEHPMNDRNLHYFARELMFQQRYRSAIDVFERHIKMNKWDLEAQQSMIYVGDCYLALGDELAALKNWHRAFDYCGRRREPLLRMAEYWFTKNDKQRTAAYAAAALEIPRVDFYGNLESNYTDRPHRLLYWAKFYLGDKDGAREHWKKAIEFRPEDETYKGDSKFFLGYDNGIDGWMLPQELGWLRDTAKKMDNIAEIGSWKGRSTEALLSGCPGTVWAIDHFNGDVNTGQQDVYQEFMNNVGHFANLRVLKMGSLDAASLFPEKGVDMVFIDGCHKEEDVRADIKAWLPGAKKLICGHDYLSEHTGVKKAVDDLVGEVKTVGSIWYKWLSSM